LCACWAGGPLWTRPGLAAAPDCQQRMEKQFKSCRIGRPPAMCNSLQPPIEHRQETKSCNVRFGSNADILGCQRDVCLLPKADILPRYHPLVWFSQMEVCWEIDYKLLNWKKRETKVKQEQRAVVIDSLLNEANKQGDRTNVEGTTVKKVAPVK
ncbi:MAG: hypothetical protein WAO14_13855, partial [Pseudolabrys sp.]